LLLPYQRKAKLERVVKSLTAINQQIELAAAFTTAVDQTHCEGRSQQRLLGRLMARFREVAPSMDAEGR